MTDDFDLDPVSPVNSILTPDTEPDFLDVKTTNSLENIDQLRQFRAEKIKEIYPDLTDRDFNKYIELRNDSDGNGDYIAKWEHPTLSRPTDEQLAQITE